jgi:hypothetical protein
MVVVQIYLVAYHLWAAFYNYDLAFLNVWQALGLLLCYTPLLNPYMFCNHQIKNFVLLHSRRFSALLLIVSIGIFGGFFEKLFFCLLI